MGVGTLLVIDWGTRTYGDDVGRTMGFVTFAFFNIAFSLATKDETRSALSREVLADRTLAIATVVSVLVIIAATEVGLMNRLLDTVSLGAEQWLLCGLVGLSLLPISEVRKHFWHIPVNEVPEQA